ncbi:MAG: insulinase family protein [Gemmatimonadetes bacterium]|nr:insulinase family protein [Gemmatimonadota bacterium]
MLGSRTRVLLGAACAATTLGAQARPAVGGADVPVRRGIAIDRSVLPNGLTLQLVEDHSSQVVAVSLWFDVGSRDEVKGKTGFAHLFEHMMFQGSTNVKKGEHSQLIERAGGSDNANTQYDITRYYAVVPSNRINLVLWLEAERLRTLAVTPENLKNQIEAVKEERRLRVDNQPYGTAIWESTLAMSDPNTCFGYAHSLIGSMDDLNASSVDDVKAFFQRYYAPNNGTLTIVGDINKAEVKWLVSEYFGAIPRQPAPPRMTCEQKFNTGAIETKVNDDKATLPAVIVQYRVPATGHADTPALDLLTSILGAGESSRFNRILAREAKVALGSQLFLNPFGPRRGPGQWLALGIANQGVTPEALRDRMILEIEKVAKDGVTPAELERAKNQYRASKVNERQTAFSLTEVIQHATFYLGGPESVNTDLDRYAAVTMDDIKRVATAYFRRDNSQTITIVPGGK